MKLRTFKRPAVGALCLAAALAATQASPATAQYYDDERDDDRGYGQRYDDRAYDGQRYDDQGYGRNGQDDWDASARPDDVDDVSFFYDELSEHGRWSSHPEYGYVWSPSGVDSEWRPYTRGTWANSDEHGWYWVSEEPFGWATYHYGRWFHDDRYGWQWVPGTTWGPAWVAWRNSDDYVGWAPLPPDSYWDRSRGLSYDTAIYDSPRFSLYWSFVEPRYISAPSIWRHCAPRHRAQSIVRYTRPATRYDWRDGHIFNAGVAVSFFDRLLGSPLPRVRVYTSEHRYARGHDRRAGNSIRVWRPDFSRRDSRVERERRERRWSEGTWRNVDRPRPTRLPAAVAPERPNPGRGDRPDRFRGGDDRGGPDRGERPDWRREREGRRAATPNQPVLPDPPAVTAPPPREDRRRGEDGDRRPDRGARPDWRREREGGRTATPSPAAPTVPPAVTAPAPREERPRGGRDWFRNSPGDGSRGQGPAGAAPPPASPPAAAVPPPPANPYARRPGTLPPIVQPPPGAPGRPPMRVPGQGAAGPQHPAYGAIPGAQPMARPFGN